MTHLIRKQKSPFNNTLATEFLTPFTNIFDEFFGDNYPEFVKKSGISYVKGSYPKVDIFDYEDKIVIEAEIPGLSKEDINIKTKYDKELKSDILILSGEKNINDKHKDANCVWHELKRSAFARSFELTDNIDKDKIDAEFKDGILDITLPKIKPTQIEENEKYISIK